MAPEGLGDQQFLSLLEELLPAGGQAWAEVSTWGYEAEEEMSVPMESWMSVGGTAKLLGT